MDWDQGLDFPLKHDLVGKPVSIFPDHALRRDRLAAERHVAQPTLESVDCRQRTVALCGANERHSLCATRTTRRFWRPGTGGERRPRRLRQAEKSRVFGVPFGAGTPHIMQVRAVGAAGRLGSFQQSAKRVRERPPHGMLPLVRPLQPLLTQLLFGFLTISQTRAAKNSGLTPKGNYGGDMRR